MKSFIPKASFLLDLIKSIAPNKGERVTYRAQKSYANIGLLPFAVPAPRIYNCVITKIAPQNIVEIHFDYDSENKIYSVEFGYSGVYDYVPILRFPNEKESGIEEDAMIRILRSYYEHHFVPELEIDLDGDYPWECVEYKLISKLEFCTPKDKVITPDGVLNYLEVTNNLGSSSEGMTYNCDVTEVLRQLKFTVDQTFSNFHLSFDMEGKYYISGDDEDFSLKRSEVTFLLEHCYDQEVNPNICH